MSDFRELLIGCGHSRVKKLASMDGNPHWRGLDTLDINEMCVPDITCDINRVCWDVRHDFLRWGESKYLERIPLDSTAPDMGFQLGVGTLKTSHWDEVHAYEVLEHLGSQGDAIAFFAHFHEIWRILKPGGHLYATVPSRFSPWLWGDPSHTRAILPESLTFLDQTQYIAQLDGAQKTAMSDFRGIYKADFRIRLSTDNRETFAFVLESVKPSRCTK